MAPKNVTNINKNLFLENNILRIYKSLNLQRHWVLNLTLEICYEYRHHYPGGFDMKRVKSRNKC